MPLRMHMLALAALRIRYLGTKKHSEFCEFCVWRLQHQFFGYLDPRSTYIHIYVYIYICRYVPMYPIFPPITPWQPCCLSIWTVQALKADE